MLNSDPFLVEVTLDFELPAFAVSWGQSTQFSPTGSNSTSATIHFGVFAFVTALLHRYEEMGAVAAHQKPRYKS